MHAYCTYTCMHTLYIMHYVSLQKRPTYSTLE